MQIHVVSSGETITSIADTYQVPTWKIIYDNEIRLPDRLVPGQALLILGPEEEKEKLSLEVEGYAYPFTFVEYLEEAFEVVLNMLSFSAGFSMEGHLYPPYDEKIRNVAKSFGVAATLVLTPSDEYGRFSTELAHQAASSEIVQDNLIQELMNQMRGKGYRGVDVDFEYIPAEDKEGYVNFIRRLREAMSQEGYLVSVALAPKTSANQPGLLYEGIDYRALGEAADSVLLMTYEWGYTTGRLLYM